MPPAPTNPNPDPIANYANSQQVASTYASQGTAAITPSALSSTQTPTQFQNNTPTQPYNSSNIDPSLFAPTQPEQQANDLSTLLGSLNNANTGQQAFTAQQNQQAGVPGLVSQQNDLTAKLTALQKQQLDLQNQATYTIPNQMQQQAQGRGVTAAGLQPLTTEQLRANQIQQGSIASEALTTAATLAAVQGNLQTAQYYVQQAVDNKFKPIQEQIAAATNNLQLIQNSPAYKLADQKRAAQQQIALAQFNAQLDTQKQNALAAQQETIKYAGIAPANVIAQMQQATSAAQVAQIAAANNVVLPSVVQAQLQNQLTQGQIAQLPLDTALKQAQLNSANVSTALNRFQLNNLSSLTDAGGNSTLGYFANTTSTGGQYINKDNISDAKTLSAVENAARQQGIPVLDKNGTAKLQAIDDTRTNLTNIQNAFQQFAYPNAVVRDTLGLFGAGKKIKDFFQTDQNISAFKSWRTAAINSIQALAGGSGSGLRINQAEIDAAIHNDIPDITDTADVGQQKISNLSSQLNSWENELLKPNAANQGSTAKDPLGLGI